MPKITFKCDNCGKEVTQYKYGNPILKFCCNVCYFEYTKREHQNKTLTEVKCKNCGKKFMPTTVKNIYCSHECSSAQMIKRNEIIKSENYAIIKTKKYDYKIDLEDFERVSQYTWNVHKHNNFPYARNKKAGLLHRFIMNCPNDKVVDHINHDVTDNRKQNLRIVTQEENLKNFNPINKNNKTGYKFITIKKDKNRIYYAVKVMKKYIGQYKDLKIAVLNRNLFLMNQDIENTIKLKIIEEDKEYKSKSLLPIEDCIAEYKKYLEWKVGA